mmetsp:Transcript_8958/g.9011  ORF Transcript_8958/g.9011 Transcript_8958/m.9011 type:complete len:105 (+) Transcript_8958:313-627(+)
MAADPSDESESRGKGNHAGRLNSVIRLAELVIELVVGSYVIDVLLSTDGSNFCMIDAINFGPPSVFKEVPPLLRIAVKFDEPSNSTSKTASDATVIPGNLIPAT